VELNTRDVSEISGGYYDYVVIPHNLAEKHQRVIRRLRQQVPLVSLVAESEGSTPLIQKPATGHDPEPVPSTSHPHNLFP
jgi:hypothetical protein